MKKLKIWNGRDWDCRGGHLWVCAHSQKDCVDLVNQAYRKIKGYDDRPDVTAVRLSEIRTYWNEGCWGNDMDGIAQERGVWWGKAMPGGWHSKPERII